MLEKLLNDPQNVPTPDQNEIMRPFVNSYEDVKN